MGIWRLGFGHGFLVVLFVIVEEKFFALFGLREVFVFLKISFGKYDQVILIVDDLWRIEIAVSDGKRIWNLHDLGDDTIWQRCLLPEISLLFRIWFGFLLVFDCLVEVIIGGLKIDGRWIAGPLAEVLHKAWFIFGIGSDLGELK